MTEKSCPLFYHKETGLMLDTSRINWPENYADQMSGKWKAALEKMAALEAGAIANDTENRQVGHYWLRCPEKAPHPRQQEQIRGLREQIRCFVRENGACFRHLLILGIGGSALGPLFLAEALSYEKKPAMDYFLLDNTDPDGFDHVFSVINGDWEGTLSLVISKSGGTIETRNALAETEAAYSRAGVDFPSHAVAVTMENSHLAQQAQREKWLGVFPMWDWVGGRTSVWSAVGLLPLALLGYDIQGLLEGASACDRLTRQEKPEENPAMLLAGLWYINQGKSMVLLPYKDRLSILTRYMQQLIMESLGKEFDRQGKEIHSGLTVFGNKGSTDQHSYMQQLLAGPETIFTVMIEVLKDREGKSLHIGDFATSGEYLQAYLLASASALRAKGRDVLIITIPDGDAYHLGVLLALFERAVGLYAELLDVNAYDQPAVELGKKSAEVLMMLKTELLSYLSRHPGHYYSAGALAQVTHQPQSVLDIFKLLLHMAVNPDTPVVMEEGVHIMESLFAVPEDSR